MNLQELYKKLEILQKQKLAIENEIQDIKSQIESLTPFSKEEKIKLFRELFVAREDVYALHWISKDGTKSGYSPQTYTFRGNDYKPITNNIIQKHLEGKVRLGTYAIINQTLSKFLVLDLDKSTFLEDARTIKKVCDKLSLNPLFELSKSGKGVHIWFFFQTLVSASSVRKLGDIIITKAMDNSTGIDMQSYDRMFPNQDFVAPDALGNLIALPLHYRSRIEGKTVFINLDTLQPYPNQWEVLKNVKKVSKEQLNYILRNNLINYTEQNSALMPWAIKQKEPLKFPKIIKATLFDAIYIERVELNNGALNYLKKLASFANPEFFIRQSLRKSTYNTPRVISLFDINERYIILPRGLLEKLKNFFKEKNIQFIVEDKREVAKIDKLTLNIKGTSNNPNCS